MSSPYFDKLIALIKRLPTQYWLMGFAVRILNENWLAFSHVLFVIRSFSFHLPLRPRHFANTGSIHVYFIALSPWFRGRSGVRVPYTNWKK